MRGPLPSGFKPARAPPSRVQEPRRGGGWDEVWPILITLAVAVVLFLGGQWLAGFVVALFVCAWMAEAQREWSGSERAGRVALALLAASIVMAVVFVALDRTWPLVLRVGALLFLLAAMAMWVRDRRKAHSDA